MKKFIIAYLLLGIYLPNCTMNNEANRADLNTMNYLLTRVQDTVICRKFDEGNYFDPVISEFGNINVTVSQSMGDVWKNKIGIDGFPELYKVSEGTLTTKIISFGKEYKTNWDIEPKAKEICNEWLNNSCLKRFRKSILFDQNTINKRGFFTHQFIIKNTLTLLLGVDPIMVTVGTQGHNTYTFNEEAFNKSEIRQQYDTVIATKWNPMLKHYLGIGTLLTLIGVYKWYRK